MVVLFLLFLHQNGIVSTQLTMLDMFAQALLAAKFNRYGIGVTVFLPPKRCKGLVQWH